MKTKSILLLFIAGIFILQSCEFQPNSENFIEITPPDTTRTIQINLSPLETQYIFTVPTLVNYDLNTFDLSVYNVEFFIGDQSIHSGTEAVGYFTFDPEPWGIGTQTLTMVVTTNTNTGSLADLMGAEGLLFQNSWSVLLDGGSPAPVEITDIFNDDGMLKIEWEEYERINFQKYIVYKNFSNKEWEGEKHILAEITDPETTEFYDASYIGDTATYWVEIYASNKKATSQQKQFMYATTPMDTVWVNNSSAKFIWRKNPFYRAIKKVALTTPDYYPQPDIELFSTENTSDTICIAEGLKFGSEKNYTLTVYPKSDIQIYQDNQNLRSTVSFGIGKSLPRFENVIGSPQNNYFYLMNPEKIYQYSFPDFSVSSTTENKFNSSRFISNYDYSLCAIFNHEMRMYPSVDIKEFKIIQDWDIGFHSYFSNTSISSDNKIIGAVGFGIGMYDFDLHEMVFTQNDEALAGCTLSPDGKFAVSFQMPGVAIQQKISIYKVFDTGLQLIGELPFNVYSQANWIPGTGHQLYILEGYETPISGKMENKFSIYNPASSSYENEIMMKIGHFAGIDIARKRVAIWDQIPNNDRKNKMYIYNYETGSIEKTIPLTPDIDKLYFWNSYIFSSEGFTINLSNY